MKMARSYNGWTASRDPQEIGINRRWEPIAGHDFPGGIKAGDVETIFTYLVRQLDARVEPIEEYPPGDEWGWNYRANVNNPDTLSCHASGTAIDYNATQHPNRVPFTWTRDQVREIHRILDELDGVVRWLEGFDEMHFEIRGNPMQVARVAARLRENPAPPPPPPPPPIVMEDTPMLIRRIENPNQSVLIVQDKTSPIGVRGFFAEAKPGVKGEEGILGGDEKRVDKGAWKAIFDDWLVKADVVVRT